MSKPVALLDVDHTLLFNGTDLNISLLDSLLAQGIKDVYLFTDMKISSSDLSDRERLIKQLQDREIQVHGVITPLDLLWQKVPANQSQGFEQYLFEKELKRYSGEEFDTILRSEEAIGKFPFLADYLNADLAQIQPGIAYQQAVAKLPGVEEGQPMPDDLNGRSRIAKMLGDQWALNRGYSHTKGLLLEVFLKNKPEWVSSIIIADDNGNVFKSISEVKESSTPISVIHVSKLNEQQRVYDQQLKSHLEKDPSSASSVHLFLFDRDSTLVPGVGHDLPEDELLNKDQMAPLLRQIISDGHPWAILSTGNVDGLETNAHTAIKKISDYSQNPPVNPSISKGMEGVLNALPGIRSSDRKELIKEQLNSLGIKFDGKSINSLTDSEPDDCMNVVQFGIYHYSEETQQHSLILKDRSERIIGEITIDPNATFEIKYGETTLVINTLKWMQSSSLHVDGDNKFFQALKAIDALKLKIDITADIERLGVISIKTPDTYRSVHPSNITMLDDKQSVCNLMVAAGFCAILADTPEKAKNKEAEVNTYINKFAVRVNQLPQHVSEQINYAGWSMIAAGLTALVTGTALAATGVGVFVGLGLALAGIAAVIAGAALLLKSQNKSQVRVENDDVALKNKNQERMQFFPNSENKTHQKIMRDQIKERREDSDDAPSSVHLGK